MSYISASQYLGVRERGACRSLLQAQQKVLEDKPQKCVQPRDAGIYQTVATSTVDTTDDNDNAWLQEPFCPPKPALPRETVAASQFSEDLHKLYNVSTSSTP